MITFDETEYGGRLSLRDGTAFACVVYAPKPPSDYDAANGCLIELGVTDRWIGQAGDDLAAIFERLHSDAPDMIPAAELAEITPVVRDCVLHKQATIRR